MDLKNTFFEYVYAKTKGEPFELSANSAVCGENVGYAKKYAESVISVLGENGKKADVFLSLSMPERIAKETGSLFSDNEESYAVEITDEKINLFSPSRRGLIYAVATLKHLIESDSLCSMLLFDFPDKAVRGYRVFIPGREHFDDFKRVVDFITEYKYNAIMMEVGGAMEYKRRPEINQKWVEYCKMVQDTPGGAQKIQKGTYSWQKNSIHADNGGRSYITQDELRELIEYCRERELEVIPEVPSLCHSDYVVFAYPELRERKDDMHPDTYCPSNPKSYEIMFDILDEVVDVFRPNYMNIGHDECYSLAQCELCKGKSPVDLYVGDIIKIHDYLAGKNVKTMMWGEKLFGNVYFPDDYGVMHGYGGSGDEMRGIPRLAECAGKIPLDITLLHWYYSLCTREEEKSVHDLGYRMILGNLQGVMVRDYRERSPLFDGGFFSNWGLFAPEYMQRNGQNFNLISTAYILWSKTYDTKDAGKLIKKTKERLYDIYLNSLGDDIIELEHTTDYDHPYRSFYDGIYINTEEWTIGYHIVSYIDGTKEKLPIVFGENIRSMNEKGNADSGSEEAKPSSYIEVLGKTLPRLQDDKMYYKTAYKNPHPEKKIKSIRTETIKPILIETEYNV